MKTTDAVSFILHPEKYNTPKKRLSPMELRKVIETRINANKKLIAQLEDAHQKTYQIERAEYKDCIVKPMTD